VAAADRELFALRLATAHAAHAAMESCAARESVSATKARAAEAAAACGVAWDEARALADRLFPAACRKIAAVLDVAMQAALEAAAAAEEPGFDAGGVEAAAQRALLEARAAVSDEKDRATPRVVGLVASEATREALSRVRLPKQAVGDAVRLAAEGAALRDVEVVDAGRDGARRDGAQAAAVALGLSPAEAEAAAARAAVAARGKVEIAVSAAHHAAKGAAEAALCASVSAARESEIGNWNSAAAAMVEGESGPRGRPFHAAGSTRIGESVNVAPCGLWVRQRAVALAHAASPMLSKAAATRIAEAALDEIRRARTDGRDRARRSVLRALASQTVLPAGLGGSVPSGADTFARARAAALRGGAAPRVADELAAAALCGALDEEAESGGGEEKEKEDEAARAAGSAPGGKKTVHDKAHEVLMKLRRIKAGGTMASAHLN
jgi:hypothetical protein